MKIVHVIQDQLNAQEHLPTWNPIQILPNHLPIFEDNQSRIRIPQDNCLNPMCLLVGTEKI
jgi:hypothetical protein